MAIDLKNYDAAIMALGIGISAGTGAPSYTAKQGSLYVRTDGSST